MRLRVPQGALADATKSSGIGSIRWPSTHSAADLPGPGTPAKRRRLGGLAALASPFVVGALGTPAKSEARAAKRSVAGVPPVQVVR